MPGTCSCTRRSGAVFLIHSRSFWWRARAVKLARSVPRHTTASSDPCRPYVIFRVDGVWPYLSSLSLVPDIELVITH